MKIIVLGNKELVNSICVSKKRLPDIGIAVMSVIINTKNKGMSYAPHSTSRSIQMLAQLSDYDFEMIERNQFSLEIYASLMLGAFGAASIFGIPETDEEKEFAKKSFGTKSDWQDKDQIYLTMLHHSLVIGSGIESTTFKRGEEF